MNLSSKMHLNWANFKENIASSFADLRLCSDFTDVTLACEGTQRIEAHKVVLAASSPVFKEILKATKTFSPLVYMRGIKTKDLVSIVDFIYHGEVNILQEDLADFLALAEELQIKGLRGEVERPIDQKENQVVSFAPNAHFQENEIKEETEDFSNHDMNISMETKYNSTNGSEDSELDTVILSMMQYVDKVWSCKVCGKSESKFRGNVRKHVEAKHVDQSLKKDGCDQCDQSFTSRDNLARHVRRAHKCLQDENKI